MITRLSIANEDFLGSSIAPQVMPPCSQYMSCLKRNSLNDDVIYEQPLMIIKGAILFESQKAM